MNAFSVTCCKSDEALDLRGNITDLYTFHDRPRLFSASASSQPKVRHQANEADRHFGSETSPLADRAPLFNPGILSFCPHYMPLKPELSHRAENRDLLPMPGKLDSLETLTSSVVGLWSAVNGDGGVPHCWLECVFFSPWVLFSLRRRYNWSAERSQRLECGTFSLMALERVRGTMG